MGKNNAVIGCGYCGKNLVRNFAQLGAPHTICDSDPEKLEYLKSLYPETNTSIDYHHVLADQNIQGIVVATPAASHYSMAKEALHRQTHLSRKAISPRD